MKNASPESELPRARLIAVAWVLVGLIGLAAPGVPPLLQAVGSDLLTLLAVIAVALIIGVPLGALAGSGPRWVDAGLGFTTDWIAAIPGVLLVAFVRPAGVTLLGSLLLLGALRSLEVGWVVRSALLRAAELDPTWAARSLGYMPLAVFLRRRLPAAAGPTLAHLAFTPAWTFLLDSVASAAGLGAASSPRSLGALFVNPGTPPLHAAAALLAVVLLTWALHRLGGHYGLRLAGK